MCQIMIENERFLVYKKDPFILVPILMERKGLLNIRLPIIFSSAFVWLVQIMVVNKREAEENLGLLSKQVHASLDYSFSVNTHCLFQPGRALSLTIDKYVHQNDAEEVSICSPVFCENFLIFGDKTGVALPCERYWKA